jgi:hypothetical protein
VLWGASSWLSRQLGADGLRKLVQHRLSRSYCLVHHAPKAPRLMCMPLGSLTRCAGRVVRLLLGIVTRCRCVGRRIRPWWGHRAIVRHHDVLHGRDIWNSILGGVGVLEPAPDTRRVQNEAGKRLSRTCLARCFRVKISGHDVYVSAKINVGYQTMHRAIVFRLANW